MVDQRRRIWGVVVVGKELIGQIRIQQEGEKKRFWKTDAEVD